MTTKTATKLTKKETVFVTALVKGLYAEPGFSDVCPSDLFEVCGGDKAVAGLIGSLEKKGVIWIDDDQCHERYILDRAPMMFIHLEEDHYYLHARWAKEQALNA